MCADSSRLFVCVFFYSLESLKTFSMQRGKVAPSVDQTRGRTGRGRAPRMTGNNTVEMCFCVPGASVSGGDCVLC